MEETTKVNSQNKNIFQFKILKIITLFIIFLLLISLWLMFHQIAQNNELSNIVEILQRKIDVIESEDKRSVEEIYEEGQTAYFKEDILLAYRQDETIKSEEVKKAYPLTVEDKNTIWLVETGGEGQINSYYILTPTFQKKLEHVVSTNYGDDVNCELDKKEIIGLYKINSGNFSETKYYLVLSNINCLAYGGGESVSAYSLEDGDKILFSGKNFKVDNKNGISDSGNAMGRLRGVYGYNQPVVVVEYGYFSNPVDERENVRGIAYFDLQTGRLIGVDNFQ